MDETSWKIVAELHRCRNVTRTAERLFMSQPALSKRLQAIEAELGVSLAHRSTRGITFTPEGDYLAEEAARMLAHLGEIRRNLLRFGTGHIGTIRLGMTNGFARYTLPACLKRYKADCPEVAFDITTDISAQLVRRLEQGEIHLAFIRGDATGDVERLLIGTEQACLVHAEPIALGDLPQTPQITYLSDPFALRLLDGWWHSHFDRSPMIGMRANHGDTCLEMIANGLGYGIFLSPNFVDRAQLLYRAPLFYADGLPFQRRSWMIWKAEAARLPLIGNFLDHMRSVIAEGLGTD